MRQQIETIHISLSHSLSFWVVPLLEEGSDLQPGLCRCASNAGQHHIERSEGFAGPVDADEAKQSVLNRIPLGAS